MPNNNWEEKIYQIVLQVAEPLYDPASNHIDVAIFEEQLWRELEPALHSLLSQQKEEWIKEIEGMKKRVEWRSIQDAESHIYSMRCGYDESLDGIIKLLSAKK